MYLAIEYDKEVLPVPGGPTSNMILPSSDPLSFPAAINSKILSLTSSIP